MGVLAVKSMSEQALLEQVRSLLKELSGYGDEYENRPFIALQEAQNIDLLPLSREGLGRYFHFEAALPYLLKIQNTLKQIPLDKAYIQNLPSPWRAEIRNNAEALLGLIQSILEYEPIVKNGEPSPEDRRAQIITKAQKKSDAIVVGLESVIAHASRNKPVSETVHIEATKKVLEEAKASLNGILEYKKEVMDELDSTRKQIKTTESEVRKLASQQGITTEAQHFDTAMQSYKSLSNAWLALLVVLLAGLVLWAFLLLKGEYITYLPDPYAYPADVYTIVVAQFVLAKVLVTSVLLFAIYFVAGNFRANSHNYILNRHRAEALKTYKAMIEAGKTQDKRDIVLMQAASCIYAPQETGFTGKGASKQGATVNVPITLPQLMGKLNEE